MGMKPIEKVDHVTLARTAKDVMQRLARQADTPEPMEVETAIRELLERHRHGPNANSSIFPPSAHPYGQSYAKWTEAWWQKFMRFDCANSPFTNTGNGLLQDGTFHITVQ